MKEEKVMPSVNFIKAFINMNAKTCMKKKADGLLKHITLMADKKVTQANEPCVNELISSTKYLRCLQAIPLKKHRLLSGTN